MPATAAAERALWDAEQARLDGAADPAAWQAAAGAWQQLGRPYPVAYAQWRHTEALLAGGAGAEAAAGTLRSAHAAAVRLGAAPLRTQIEALARRARISLTVAEPEPSPPPSRPHGLTDREAAVLRLLAAGHTNREIGQQLFIRRPRNPRHAQCWPGGRPPGASRACAPRPRGGTSPTHRHSPGLARPGSSGRLQRPPYVRLWCSPIAPAARPGLAARGRWAGYASRLRKRMKPAIRKATVYAPSTANSPQGENMCG